MAHRARRGRLSKWYGSPPALEGCSPPKPERELLRADNGFRGHQAAFGTMTWIMCLSCFLVCLLLVWASAVTSLDRSAERSCGDVPLGEHEQNDRRHGRQGCCRHNRGPALDV